ncbi:hypothetical protein [Thermoanaerobacterium sp. RBIITD]|uniref:hypothetical protein n=1 Tax=Thermoanaerobacterium sp. RBIITD TaxID=1550240 RepID=UPI000BB7E716|nr:hypothetical protein [Thermoanaerobacterium sp. RBIITD]SNX52707.1 hypothetical protein SAMN05660242_0129 [Thermoanaerobacterium sp. RBIITD]
MKILRKIAIWIVISFVLQFVVLFYVNNYFLTDSAMVKTKKIVTTNTSNSNEINEIKVNIPSNATNIKPSYDGKYLSYILNNELIILDTKTSKIVKSIYIDGNDIDYYKWLSDRNRVLYLHKELIKKVENLNIETYDVDNDQSNSVNKTVYNSYKSHVTDLTVSPLTNIIYINVAGNNVDDKLFQINIMGEVKEIKLPVSKIEKMYETQKTDNLIYESSNNIVHIIKNGKNDIYLSKEKYSLIGIDSSDYIYVGKLKNNLIVKIYYGKADDPLKDWHPIDIDNPIKPDEIFLAPKDDNLYKIDNGRDLINLFSNKKIYGPGEFITYNENYFEYRNGDNIILKKY